MTNVTSIRRIAPGCVGVFPRGTPRFVNVYPDPRSENGISYGWPHLMRETAINAASRAAAPWRGPCRPLYRLKVTYK